MNTSPNCNPSSGEGAEWSPTGGREASLEEGTFQLRPKDVSSEPDGYVAGQVRGRGPFWAVPGCSRLFWAEGAVGFRALRQSGCCVVGSRGAEHLPMKSTQKKNQFFLTCGPWEVLATQQCPLSVAFLG